MMNKRSAGILLHPTSLPGKFGIGELGNEAINFINFLHAAGQTLWQIFPLGPTGYGNSPYQSFSAFAGNPYLISLEKLYEEGLLSQTELELMPESDPHKIDYGSIFINKFKVLHLAYNKMKKQKKTTLTNYNNFCEVHKNWLDDYALFMAVKNYHGGKHWKEWNNEIAFRKEDAVKKWEEKLSDEINFQKFLQFEFMKQWQRIKEYANEKGIQIIGDRPMFVAYDSSDVWAAKELFSVDKNGNLETMAGVPPDYFSPTGQLWGNPLYRWEKMEENGFNWWIKQFERMYELVDIIRLDHFRGLESYWEIPGNAENAINGRWVKAPGEKLLTALKNSLGKIKILAEDLGVITPEVEALRDKFNLPGMKILQFAFGENGDKNFLPHNHIKNCCVYTGSHDNDTTKGFFEKEKLNNTGVFEWAQKYLNYYGDDICMALIIEAYKSVADIVIIPMQDILNLGSEARMNFPSKAEGNWQWRFTWEQVYPKLSEHYKNMTKMFQRSNEEFNDA
jgi:4-alpha-glucanotransferase